MKLPTVDEAGVIAVSLSENMKASDQALFVAGFQEAIKYLESNDQREWRCSRLQKKTGVVTVHSTLWLREKTMANFADIKPTETGLWLFKCYETDYEAEHVAITKDERGLLVHDSGLGVTDLDSFHDGLTNCGWLKVS